MNTWDKPDDGQYVRTSKTDGWVKLYYAPRDAPEIVPDVLALGE